MPPNEVISVWQSEKRSKEVKYISDAYRGCLEMVQFGFGSTDVFVPDANAMVVLIARASCSDSGSVQA
jgi:hypothetical protein